MARIRKVRELRWTMGAGGFMGEVRLDPIVDPVVLRKVQRGRPLLFLTELYVHPLRRQKGWANELIRTCTAYADTAGIDLWLYAYPFGNGERMTVKQLVTLYGTHGFRPIKGAGYQDEMVRRWRG